MNWIVLSLLATIFFSGVILFTKGIALKGVTPAVLNFWFFALATIGFAAMAVWRSESLKLPGGTILMFLGLALVALGYNDLFVRALSEAPNPGYVQAILSLNMVIVAVVAVFAFGSDFSFVRVAGLLLTLVGVSTLCLAK